MLSVIIPSYQPEKYIVECLNALEQQTLRKEFFEVIVILNGPEVPYYLYLQNLLDLYSFQHKFLYTEIAGVSNARNIGLDNARGNFVCFIDDDDVVSDCYLEELYKLADTDSIVVTNVLTFENHISFTGKDYLSRAFERSKGYLSHSLFRERSFFSSCWCKLIPMSIIQDRRFNLNISLGEDALFMASISDKVKNIVLTPVEAVYYRRLRQGSASRGRYSFSQVVHNKLMLIYQYLKLYTEHFPHYNILFFLSRIAAVLMY